MKHADVHGRARRAFVVLVVLNLALIGIQILRYPPLLAIPGALPYLLEPTLLLLLYGIAIVWMTRRTNSVQIRVVRGGIMLGLIGGGLELIHIGQEDFIDAGPTVNGLVAVVFTVGVFLVWGAAGYRIGRARGGVGRTVLTGAWSAVVTMVVTVFGGFLLEFYVHVPAPVVVATWGEFTRSGWTDIAAFTTANTLDAAFTHLLVGPIIGAVCGGLGGRTAQWRRPTTPSSGPV